jgi:metal-dependent hydrolase (beta-lactamase superfamily II)
MNWQCSEIFPKDHRGRKITIAYKSELIQRTIADIKAIGPNYIIPMHCIGFAFAREMPGQFIINTAGTRYIFTA